MNKIKLFGDILVTILIIIGLGMIINEGMWEYYEPTAWTCIGCMIWVAVRNLSKITRHFMRKIVRKKVVKRELVIG